MNQKTIFLWATKWLPTTSKPHNYYNTNQTTGFCHLWKCLAIGIVNLLLSHFLFSPDQRNIFTTGGILKKYFHTTL